jgi:hypothetical protein
MAFGKQSGFPASARQVQELLGLLQEAGHVDFRDARGPMGFTQRQAGGKFTVDEVTAFIEQLQNAEEAEAAGGGGGGGGGDQPPTKPATRLTAAEQTLRPIPDHQLAAELQRRGWIVIEP